MILKRNLIQYLSLNYLLKKDIISKSESRLFVTQFGSPTFYGIYAFIKFLFNFNLITAVDYRLGEDKRFKIIQIFLHKDD